MLSKIKNQQTNKQTQKELILKLEIQNVIEWTVNGNLESHIVKIYKLNI